MENTPIAAADRIGRDDEGHPQNPFNATRTNTKMDRKLKEF